MAVSRQEYYVAGMKKDQLARQLARQSQIPTGAAADQVDRVVSDLLKRVRKGQSASLPGLGTFLAGREEDFQFDHAPATPRSRKKGEK